MGRRDRRPQPDPSAQVPTVADVPRAATESPPAGSLGGEAGYAPTLPPPAPPEPAYRARVAIQARPLGQWSAGDLVPPDAAQALLRDGFVLGRELEQLEDQ